MLRMKVVIIEGIVHTPGHTTAEELKVVSRLFSESRPMHPRRVKACERTLRALEIALAIEQRKSTDARNPARKTKGLIRSITPPCDGAFLPRVTFSKPITRLGCPRVSFVYENIGEGLPML